MDFDLLKQELVRDEGLRLKPYKCTAGKLTIGVGRNLDDVGITRTEALHMLDGDVAKSYVATIRVIGEAFNKLTDARQRALVNMCFNLGAPGFRNFLKMIAAVQAGDFEGAADEMLNSKWAKQVGSRAERLAEMMRKGE